MANGFARLRGKLAIQTWQDEGVSLSDYRQRQKLREIDDMKDTATRITQAIGRGVGKPAFLIVVVTQADLYEDSLEDAYRFYCGDHADSFGAEITRLRNSVGATNLSVEILPVCTWLEDFQWGDVRVRSTLKPYHRDHYIIQLVRRLERLAIDTASR